MSISERARAGVTEMPEREHNIAERFRLVAEEWAEVDAAFYMLENTRTAVAAELILKEVAKGTPVSKAEHIAKASPEYREHINKAGDAKHRANVLKARMDYLRMRERKEDRQEWNARIERKMGRTGT
jgi:hypothetical protein